MVAFPVDVEEIRRLVRAQGPCDNSDLIEEIVLTALKLVRDDASRGDLRMISTALKEMRYTCKVFKPYRRIRKVSLFGSARTPPDAPVYQHAKAFAAAIVRHGYMVITGAGPGIMQAGNEGAGRERSFGLNIRLPFEQQSNPTIAGDPKNITYRYFFTRKLAFVKETSALVAFPGGFGTCDELFETLTLMQTGRANPMPVILMEEPCGTFWRSWENRVLRHLIVRGLISEHDRNIVTVTDDVDIACETIIRFYRVYHSLRFVREALVLRLCCPLSEDTLDDLNHEFRDILTTGRIIQGPALPEEENEPELASLPRLIFRFNRRDFGRLRLLIDRVNQAPITAEAVCAPGTDPAGEATAQVTTLEGENGEEETD